MFQGMAFGAGSEIDHSTLRSFFGGNSTQQPSQVQNNSSQSYCQPQNNNFIECLKFNNNDISNCQTKLDELKICESNNN